MKPQQALLVFWYFYEILFRSSAIPLCLKWNTSNASLTVECSVISVTDNISIIDPVGEVRAQYMWESKGRNTSTIHGINVTTSKEYNEGEWKCRHGKEETTSQVSYTKRNSHMIDIDISAEHNKSNEGNWYKLACFSCWIPQMHGVDIFVNGAIEDSIRYEDDDCYHKNKLCKKEACTCEAKGRGFTWTYISKLPIVQLACAMRFQDKIKYTSFIHKVELTFNGTVFIKETNTNESLSPSDKSPNGQGINLDKAGGKTNAGLNRYWLLGGSGLIILVCGIITTVTGFYKCYMLIHVSEHTVENTSNLSSEHTVENTSNLSSEQSE